MKNGCSSCGKAKTKGFLFGICVACQDYILKQRAKDFYEERSKLTGAEYHRMNEIRDSIREERKLLSNAEVGLEIIELIKRIK